MDDEQGLLQSSPPAAPTLVILVFKLVEDVVGGTVSVNCVEVVVGVLLVVVLVVEAFLKVFAPEERSIKLSLWCMH